MPTCTAQSRCSVILMHKSMPPRGAIKSPQRHGHRHQLSRYKDDLVYSGLRGASNLFIVESWTTESLGGIDCADVP